jgi:SAM-dependent methyltransferase
MTPVDKREFDNEDFWDRRYRALPELGSGPGSRGYAAWFKRRFVLDYLREHRFESIIDIGCGDLCWLEPEEPLPASYVGVDISKTVLDANRAKFPELTFIQHDIVKQPLGQVADLTICFDVLIHQTDQSSFESALRNTLACIGERGLISYKAPDRKLADFPPELPPEVESDEEAFQDAFQAQRLSKKFEPARTTFFGDLRKSVGRVAPGLKIRPAARYRSHPAAPGLPAPRAQVVYEISR